MFFCPKCLSHLARVWGGLAVGRKRPEAAHLMSGAILGRPKGESPKPQEEGEKEDNFLNETRRRRLLRSVK